MSEIHKHHWKTVWLDIADVLNHLRMVPRIMLIAAGSFLLWYSERVTSWYMALPIEQQTTQNSTFVTATIGAIGVSVTWYFSAYTNGPRSSKRENGNV